MKNILIVSLLFLISNLTTLGKFWLPYGEIAVFLTILGVIGMPIITARMLYKIAVKNKQTNFFKGFMILTTLYTITNIPAFVGDLDGHGSALFNFIYLVGLIVCLLTSIMTHLILQEKLVSMSNGLK